MTHRSRNSTAVRGVLLAAASVGAMLFWAADARATAPTITPIPATSGEHGYPYDAVPQTPLIAGAPSINLAALGYVEREFELSGGATVYRQNGFWSPDGRWSVSVAQTNVPYTTRLLVRYPTNPAKFNGTVVFEWLNDTTGGDQDPVWSELYNELLSQGYAYVGVTAQTAGMNDLKTWDPERYGALGDSNDGQSYDIFTQAAEAVRAESATLLGGLTPKHLIATGDSQSAFRIDTYVNAIQPITHAFDGFMAVGRAVTAAPLGNGLLSTSPFPALIRTDNAAPFIQLNTQGDIVELDAAAARQPDNADLRTWELPGAAHIDAHEATYELETIAREEPTVPIPRCVFGTPIEGTGTPLDGVNQVNNMPLFEVEDAAMAALENWVANGVPAPHAQPISTIPVFFGLYDLVPTDQYGIALGGIRLPEAEAPVEDYSPLNFSTPSSGDLTPSAIVSEVESALTALSTGSIDNAAVRSAGLCLLSGYFTELEPIHAPGPVSDARELRVEVHSCGKRRGRRWLLDAGRRARGDRQRAGRTRAAADARLDDPLGGRRAVAGARGVGHGRAVSPGHGHDVRLVQREVTRRLLCRPEPPQNRLLRGAEILRARAARPEATPRRRVDRARQLAPDPGLCLGALGGRVGHRDRLDQRLGVGVRWPAVDVIAGPQLDDLAEIHDRDPIREVLHDRQVVRDDDRGALVLGLEALHQVEHLGADRDVERTDRFVGDDHLGLEHQHPGERDPLALSTGELVRIALERVAGKPYLVEQLADLAVLVLAAADVLDQQRLA